MIKYYFENKIDYKLIANTYNLSFKREPNEVSWKWRFENNPNDNRIFINYILENNKIAAYYAISPCKITIKGVGDFKIALSNMVMTHPAFQNKGYFKLLAEDMYKTLKDYGYIGVIGFANHNSHYSFRKHLNRVDLFALNIFCVTKQSYRPYPKSAISPYSFIVSDVNEEIISMSSKMRTNSNEIFLSRDNENLSWRFLNHPSRKYKSLLIMENKQLYGIIIYKYFEGGIDLMEFFYQEAQSNNRYELLGRSIEYLMNFDLNSINIWSNLHHQEHIELEKIGFHESKFCTYFGVIPFLHESKLTNPKNWHFRFMDSDNF